MRATNASLIAAIVVCGLTSFVGGASVQEPRPHPDLQQFLLLTGADDDLADRARDEIAAAWRDGYAGMVWDMLRFMRPPPLPRPFRAPRAFDSNDPFRRLGGSQIEREHPTTRVYRRLIRLIEEQTGERFGNDVGRWQQWIWQQPYDPHPEYARFKGLWYGQIDPRFREFFPPMLKAIFPVEDGGTPRTIILDEDLVVTLPG